VSTIADQSTSSTSKRSHQAAAKQEAHPSWKRRRAEAKNCCTGKPADALERCLAPAPLLERRPIASSCSQQASRRMQGHQMFGTIAEGLLGSVDLHEQTIHAHGPTTARPKGATIFPLAAASLLSPANFFGCCNRMGGIKNHRTAQIPLSWGQAAKIHPRVVCSQAACPRLPVSQIFGSAGLPSFANHLGQCPRDGETDLS